MRKIYLFAVLMAFVLTSFAQFSKSVPGSSSFSAVKVVKEINNIPNNSKAIVDSLCIMTGLIIILLGPILLTHLLYLHFSMQPD